MGKPLRRDEREAGLLSYDTRSVAKSLADSMFSGGDSGQQWGTQHVATRNDSCIYLIWDNQ